MAWQLTQGRAGRQLRFIPEFCSCGEARGQRDEPGCRREAGRGFHTPVSTAALHPLPSLAGRSQPQRSHPSSQSSVPFPDLGSAEAWSW